MIIDVLTLFPDMFSGLASSIIKRAVDKQIITINIHDFRKFSKKKSLQVDDYSYGGGAGMVISVEPIVACLRSIAGYEQAHKILMSPIGTIYGQNKALELANYEHLIIICGHYEGIDDRILNYVDEVISIGDFILTGGEIVAMAIIDSVGRLLPDALGNNQSTIDESFQEMLLEYPQYTRPEVFDSQRVPEVLISGDHEKIRQYRRFKSLERTYQLRPDLLAKASLTSEDAKWLEKIKKGETL
ncbi:MAG: tRNA (guanosine(37)-N1)-methyltransferase TrmD [Bacilli bacterium]